MKRQKKPEKVKTLPSGYRIGIGNAAKYLGVTYQHLRLVCNGERKSASLLAKVKEHFPELINA